MRASAFPTPALRSVKGIECIVQINETTVEENAAQCLCATVEVQGGPWLFQGAALRSCGAIAIQCSRRSLAKCRGCVIGGVSHDRLMQAIAGKAMMGMQARDFARVVVEETTFEMTGGGMLCCFSNCATSSSLQVLLRQA